MKILNYILRVIVAATFLFSAFTKLYPIEPFELTLIDIGISSWSFSPILARLLVGIEIFLGIVILINLKYLRSFLNAALILTLFFSFYLILLWAFRGNDMNCGCFGDFIKMTPSESLIKNAVLVLVILMAIKTHIGFKRNYIWVRIGLAIVALTLPFILNVVEIDRRHPDNKEYPYSFPIEDLDLEYRAPMEVNMNEGEYVLAFLSTSCSHCKVAAQKLGIARRKYKLPPIKVFFIGNDASVAVFHKEVNAEFEYVLFNNPDIYKITNAIFPSIFHVKNGHVYKQWNGSELSYSEMEFLSETIKKAED